jgi:hypothetical protein
MPMPTEPVDGAPPSESAAATPGAATAAPPPISSAPLALVREVQGPTHDRGRVAGLAMVCSAAGVALGFALAGSLFAAMAPPRAMMAPAGYGACSGARAHHAAAGFHYVQAPPRAWLGVTLTVRNQSSPAVLTGVFADAPAHQAGLRVGDRVTVFDGELVDGAVELLALIRAHQPGDVVSLEAISRDGQTVTVPALRLTAMPLPVR